jgi:hypothetical protein
MYPCTSSIIDRKNGNTKWQESEKTEMEQLAKYKIFIDKGVGGKGPDDYKMILCHMIL